MLVTFSSRAGGNVTMFGEAAGELLRMMGHSGTIPSALHPRDIPAAIAHLERALEVAEAQDESPPDARADTLDDDEPPPVGLSLRAYPLVELLRAAAREDCDVMWREGASAA